MLRCGGRSVHCRMLNRIPAFDPLDAGSSAPSPRPRQVVTTKTSADMAHVPADGTRSPGWREELHEPQQVPPPLISRSSAPRNLFILDSESVCAYLPPRRGLDSTQRNLRVGGPLKLGRGCSFRAPGRCPGRAVTASVSAQARVHGRESTLHS